MHGMTLYNSDFNRVRLEAANLSDTKFDGTSFEAAKLGSSNFEKASLQGVNFYMAGIEKTSFIGADLSYATLACANWYSTRKETRHPKVSFRGANLSNATMNGADLRGSDFSEAIVVEADFDNTELSGADLRLAKGLTQPQIDGIKYSPENPPLLPPELVLKPIEEEPEGVSF